MTWASNLSAHAHTPVYLLMIRLFGMASVARDSDIAVEAESVLRHKFAVLRRQATCLKPHWADRAVITAWHHC